MKGFLVKILQIFTYKLPDPPIDHEAEAQRTQAVRELELLSEQAMALLAQFPLYRHRDHNP